MPLPSPVTSHAPRQRGSWLYTLPTLLLIAVMITLVVGWMGLATVKRLSQKEIADRLQAEVNTSESALKLWIEEQRRSAQVPSRRAHRNHSRTGRRHGPGCRPSSLKDRRHLLQTPELASLRKRLTPVCSQHNYPGFVVFDAAGLQIAALTDDALGQEITGNPAKTIARAYSGETVIALPFISANPIARRTRGVPQLLAPQCSSRLLIR